MEGNKLCDVLGLKITRVGDPVSTPEPEVAKEGIAHFLYEPPKGLEDLIKMPLNIPDDMSFNPGFGIARGRGMTPFHPIDALTFECYPKPGEAI